MKEIPLSNSTNVALVDDHHYPWLSGYAWCLQKNRANRTCYAYRVVRSPEGRKVRVYMHREILGLQDGDPREVDHRDGQGLHNVESNLRIVTPLQNAANRPLDRRSRTGHKGVSPRAGGKYSAVINVNGKATYLGLFPDVLQASFCYNTAAAHLHGEHAGLNTIPPNRIPLARQAQLREMVLAKLARQAQKTFTTSTPSQILWDATRDRWRVKVVLADRRIHVGCYPLRAEADFAAALALDADAIPDPSITPARLEFIRKRVAYLQSVHQPDPEPATT